MGFSGLGIACRPTSYHPIFLVTLPPPELVDVLPPTRTLPSPRSPEPLQRLPVDGRELLQLDEINAAFCSRAKSGTAPAASPPRSVTSRIPPGRGVAGPGTPCTVECRVRSGPAPWRRRGRGGPRRGQQGLPPRRCLAQANRARVRGATTDPATKPYKPNRAQ